MSTRAAYGREGELAEIAAFLDSWDRRPVCFLIEGVPGIGKTTMLRRLIEDASSCGLRVLNGVASEADSSVALAVLADVSAGVVDEMRGKLSPPQARALEIALLRADPEEEAPDRRAVATAALVTVRRVTSDGPLLIALDDVQWVDPSSAYGLGFVFRRLREERVLVAATLRRGVAVRDPIGLDRAFSHRSFLQRHRAGPGCGLRGQRTPGAALTHGGRRSRRSRR